MAQIQLQYRRVAAAAAGCVVLLVVCHLFTRAEDAISPDQLYGLVLAVLGGALMGAYPASAGTPY